MIFLKPLKIWAHLDNFYFHCFIGGTKGKIQNPRLSVFFLNFSLWSPLWNNENKSCLNELKFWEASEKSQIKHMLKISVFYFMWNPEICQDPPTCGQDDLVLYWRKLILDRLEKDSNFSRRVNHQTLTAISVNKTKNTLFQKLIEFPLSYVTFYCYLTCLVEVSIKIFFQTWNIWYNLFFKNISIILYRGLNILALQCSGFLLKHRSVVEFQVFIQYNFKTTLAPSYLKRRLDNDVSGSWGRGYQTMWTILKVRSLYHYNSGLIS